MLIINLPEHLDIEAASDLKATLTAEDGGDRAVCVNAQQVSRVGTACIQVLLSAGRSLSTEGRTFTINAPSPAFLAACADLGLVEELQRWSTD
ncbi:chemotaxis protein CheX [Breoghania corrubedonensis]|uniref:Chemotaxis protein CheX n=1 Tax=Breoghania corrubedonensis TaxID=665038 RepID=A0A2T5UU91_9HYPH|nr:STAS domain-containing protein [Breoghania corrubedonensis]PTW55052.1 chemotaxis protein CheX [Breoghania corrubedonensis]